MAEDKSRVQGNEVNHQEFCDEYQHRDKKNSFSMKVVEDHTCVSRVQGIEVKPQVFKFLLDQFSAKQEKSFPIESRVQGNEVKPQQ